MTSNMNSKTNIFIWFIYKIFLDLLPKNDDQEEDEEDNQEGEEHDESMIYD